MVNAPFSSIDLESLFLEPLIADDSAPFYIAMMTEADALRILSATAQAIRFKVLIVLAQAGSDGMASSDIADKLGVPRNLMSSHLAILSKARVVVSAKGGRVVTYKVRTEAISDLVEFLTTLGLRRGPSPVRVGSSETI